jgi:outer membrane biosynthesis protein TonB
MKRAALYSAIFHSALLILLMIGFRNPFHRVSLNQQPLMIEVTEIREVSTAPQLAPEAQEPEKKQAQKVPEPKQKPPEPPKPQPQPAAPQKPDTPNKPVEDKAEPATEETIPLQKPKPKKEPPKPPKEKKEKSQPKKAEVDLTKKPEKTQTKDKAKDKKDESFDNLLDDVLQDNAEDKPVKTMQGAPAAKVDNIMSSSEMDALRRRIYKCWIVPAGARGAKDLVVDIDMEIGRDGTVLKATVVDAKRMSTDSFYRAAGESAKRAVLDPKCNPLPLPADKYDQWKQLTFSFNPKDMF